MSVLKNTAEGKNCTSRATRRRRKGVGRQTGKLSKAQTSPYRTLKRRNPNYRDICASKITVIATDTLYLAFLKTYIHKRLGRVSLAQRAIYTTRKGGASRKNQTLLYFVYF